MIGKVWVIDENNNKDYKSMENSSPPHQTYKPSAMLKNINLKVDHYTEGKWSIHAPYYRPPPPKKKKKKKKMGQKFLR